MAYWLLVQRDAPGQPWAIQFGDRDRSVVEYERDDYRDHGAKARDLKILRCASARAADCNAAVAALGAE